MYKVYRNYENFEETVKKIQDFGNGLLSTVVTYILTVYKFYSSQLSFSRAEAKRWKKTFSTT